MLEKTVTISGKPVKLRASSALPRVYMMKFGRDLFKDFGKMQDVRDGSQNLGEFGEMSTVLENMAYTMAFLADPGIPEDVNEWLDQFELLGIVSVFDQIMELWNMNTLTTIKEKKKDEQPLES